MPSNKDVKESDISKDNINVRYGLVTWKLEVVFIYFICLHNLGRSCINTLTLLRFLIRGYDTIIKTFNIKVAKHAEMKIGTMML